jgi:peroxiredoxin
VSTKNHLEHITWPKRSTAIINTSKNITKETAVEYRTAYRESAVVKNALQQRQYTKGNTAASAA